MKRLLSHCLQRLGSIVFVFLNYDLFPKEDLLIYLSIAMYSDCSFWNQLPKKVADFQIVARFFSLASGNYYRVTLYYLSCYQIDDVVAYITSSWGRSI